MQEKALVAHLELHKKVVKNAWILSYEGRKVLVIEFQETVTEDESIAYLCDRTGRLVEDDDQCEKWASNQTDWRTRMMQTFLAGH